MKFQGEFILELGRSIIASSGTYITQVKDIKSNQNGNFAIVDGGMHQMVYYGSGLALNQPIMEIKPLRNQDKKILIFVDLCVLLMIFSETFRSRFKSRRFFTF